MRPLEEKQMPSLRQTTSRADVLQIQPIILIIMAYSIRIYGLLNPQGPPPKDIVFCGFNVHPASVEFLQPAYLQITISVAVIWKP